MPGRKRKATKLSLLRYKMKVGNIVYQMSPRSDIAEEVLDEQYKAWESGFKTYVSVRRIIETVISDVPPAHRVPYYMVGQRYYNLVVARRHMLPENRTAIRVALKQQAGADSTDRIVDGAKLDAIFDAIDKQFGIE